VPDCQYVEQGRRHCEAGESDEHHRDYSVPDEGDIAPQGCHYILAVDHRLTFPIVSSLKRREQ